MLGELFQNRKLVQSDKLFTADLKQKDQVYNYKKHKPLRTVYLVHDINRHRMGPVTIVHRNETDSFPKNVTNAPKSTVIVLSYGWNPREVPK